MYRTVIRPTTIDASGTWVIKKRRLGRWKRMILRAIIIGVVNTEEGWRRKDQIKKQKHHTMSQK